MQTSIYKVVKMLVVLHVLATSLVTDVAAEELNTATGSDATVTLDTPPSVSVAHPTPQLPTFPVRRKGHPADVGHRWQAHSRARANGGRRRHDGLLRMGLASPGPPNSQVVTSPVLRELTTPVTQHSRVTFPVSTEPVTPPIPSVPPMTPPASVTFPSPYLNSSAFIVIRTTDNTRKFWRKVAADYVIACRMSCENGFGSRHPWCEKCFCDDICFTYGDCCPDMYYRAGRGPLDISRNMGCQRTRLGGRFTYSDPKTMVTSCPETFKDPTIDYKCESESFDRNYNTPVVGKKSHLTFKNRFCAACHFEEDNVPWDTNVGFRYMYLGKDPLSVYSSAEEKYVAALSDARMMIIFTLPQNPLFGPNIQDIAPRDCKFTNIISDCITSEETTDLTSTDLHIEKACKSFSAPFLGQNFSVFKNPFCYMCYKRLTWGEVLVDYMLNFHSGAYGASGTIGTIGTIGVAYMVLLDFSDDRVRFYSGHNIKAAASPVKTTCSQGQYHDVQMDACLGVVCACGKERPTNSTADDLCRTISKTTDNVDPPHDSRNYGYAFCLQSSLPRDEMMFAILPHEPNRPQNFFQWMIEDFGLEFRSLELFMLYQATHQATLEEMQFLWRLLFLPSQPINRDSVEAGLLERLSDILNKFKSDLGVRAIQIAASCSPLELTRLMNISATGRELTPRVSFDASNAAEKHNAASDYIYRDYSVSGCNLSNNDYGRDEKQIHGKMGADFPYLPVNRLLNCPAVKFHPDDYVYYADSMEVVILSSTLKLGTDTGLRRVSVPNFSVENAMALVCLDQLHLKPETKASLTLHVLSLTCIVTSLAFLLVSFVVYCLLKELRHIAGLNNMLLIVSLFWAQILIHVTTYGDLIGWLCQGVGMMTHWLWLCVVFAQNACTFHMFYTLSFPLRSHAANTNVRVMATRYIVYVLTTASLIVVVVVAWQMAAEGNSGYGGQSCYLRKLTVRVAAFAVPLAGTVVANVAMFVFTVVRVRSVSLVGPTRSNRRSLVLYTKLSVFTGLTWLLGFLASALDSLPLTYVFAVLQGCQGIFIFLAFLANKRVMEMLRERVRCRRSGMRNNYLNPLQ